MITVVGLGPGDARYLSKEALSAIEEAKQLYVRTERHPTLSQLGIEAQSFDALYESAESFDEVYETIAQTLLGKSKSESLVYAVPGSPFVAERSVERLLELAPQTRVLPAPSFLEPLLQLLKVDVTSGLSIVDGLSPFEASPRQALLILQVYARDIASQVKLRLSETHGDECAVMVAGHAGIEGEAFVHARRLYELDREEDFDHLTSVYVPACEASAQADLSELENLMDRLLAPGGCPWDRAQTHESLRRYLIEEAYEVLEAIDGGDFAELQDELGDVLFQVVFHSALAKREGYFTLADVISGSFEKIYSRHSHVFGEDAAGDPDEVVDVWEKNKEKEKSVEERLARVPKTSPLHYAQKVYKLLGEKSEQEAPEKEELIHQLKSLVLVANKAGYSLDELLMEEVRKSLKI